MSDEQNPNPPNPAAGDDSIKKELEALKAKNAELLGEKKKLAAKTTELEGKAAKAAELEATVAKLNETLGIKPGGPDPEAVRQQREAQAQLAREKAEKTKDAVLEELLSSGRAIPRKVTKAILADAARLELDPETGEVVGVKELLDEWWKDLGATGAGASGEPGKPPAPPRMPQPKGGVQDDPMLKRFSTYSELAHADPEVFAAFREKFPDRFQELKANHEAAALNPTRRYFGAAPAQNTR